MCARPCGADDKALCSKCQHRQVSTTDRVFPTALSLEKQLPLLSFFSILCTKFKKKKLLKIQDRSGKVKSNVCCLSVAHTVCNSCAFFIIIEREGKWGGGSAEREQELGINKTTFVEFHVKVSFTVLQTHAGLYLTGFWE